MGSQKAVHLSVLTPHRRAPWKAAVRCAEGWGATGLREIGGVRVVGQEDMIEKASPRLQGLEI